MTLNLTHVTFDCADAASLANFWSAVLERPVDDGASADFATIGGAPGWMFLRVPEPKAAKNRMHADFTAGDLQAEVARVVALGARHLADHEEAGTVWATLADVEGNEFDIVAA